MLVCVVAKLSPLSLPLLTLPLWSLTLLFVAFTSNWNFLTITSSQTYTQMIVWFTYVAQHTHSITLHVFPSVWYFFVCLSVCRQSYSNAMWNAFLSFFFWLFFYAHFSTQIDEKCSVMGAFVCVTVYLHTDCELQPKMCSRSRTRIHTRCCVYLSRCCCCRRRRRWWWWWWWLFYFLLPFRDHSFCTVFIFCFPFPCCSFSLSAESTLQFKGKRKWCFPFRLNCFDSLSCFLCCIGEHHISSSSTF